MSRLVPLLEFNQDREIFADRRQNPGLPIALDVLPLVLPEVLDPMILHIPVSIVLLVRNRLQKAVVELNANSGCPTGKHSPVVESFSMPREAVLRVPGEIELRLARCF
jgi:hypothetical protein